MEGPCDDGGGHKYILAEYPQLLPVSVFRVSKTKVKAALQVTQRHSVSTSIVRNSGQE